VLQAYRIPIFEKQGFEADDILGTVAKKFGKKGMDLFLVTGDKDALQLVNDHVFVYNTHQNGMIYDAAKVKEKFQVEPRQVPDLMALMGDSSDNIPGVSGIGPKGAVQIIQEFETAENLLKNLKAVRNENRRRLLEENVEQIRLSRELAVIDCDIALELDLEAFRLKEPDEDQLTEIFQELEFRSLLKELPAKTSTWKTQYTFAAQKKEADEILKTVEKQELFSLEFARNENGEFLGAAFSWKEGMAGFIPMELWDQKLLSLLGDSKKRKIVHDFKEKKVKLHFQGLALEGLKSDTMLISYLLNPSRAAHELNDLSFEYLQHRGAPPEQKEGCCEASDTVLRLYHLLKDQIHERDQKKLLEEMEIPLVDVLARMEIHGVKVDPKVLQELSKEMEEQLERLTRDIYEIAGCEFNIHSPKQLSEVLFDRLKLPVVKRTKTGISTDVEVLEKLSLHHALPKAILVFRVLTKL
jgi:DNA polymerase-1